MLCESSGCCWIAAVVYVLGSPYLTFPPQNWHSSPCQPSAQTQVPFPQTPPFMQVMSVHLTSVAAAATKTHTNIIAVSVQQAVAVHPFRTHFRRYFTLNRHKNIWKNSLNILVREPFFLRVVCVAFFLSNLFNASRWIICHTINAFNRSDVIMHGSTRLVLPVLNV